MHIYIYTCMSTCPAPGEHNCRARFRPLSYLRSAHHSSKPFSVFFFFFFCPIALA